MCLHCELSPRHIAAHCDGVVTVSEQQLVAATLAAYRSGLVVEPSGAAGLAAVLGGQVSTVQHSTVLYCTLYCVQVTCHRPGERLVIVITGGNVTPGEMAALERIERDQTV